MAITPSWHNGGSPAAGLVLSQHTRAQSGCEMNEWGEEDSEGEGERWMGEVRGREKELKREQWVQIESGDWCVSVSICPACLLYSVLSKLSTEWDSHFWDIWTIKHLIPFGEHAVSYLRWPKQKQPIQPIAIHLRITRVRLLLSCQMIAASCTVNDDPALKFNLNPAQTPRKNHIHSPWRCTFTWMSITQTPRESRFQGCLDETEMDACHAICISNKRRSSL